VRCGIELRINAVRFLNILFKFPTHLLTNDLIVDVADWLLLIPDLLKLEFRMSTKRTIIVSENFLGFSTPPVLDWKIILKIIKPLLFTFCC
jgi:hypothetical protein